MSNSWFIGDTHFDHANIIKYCNRPFANVDEMNESMVKNWNETVQKEDIVYHLGDVGRNSTQDYWLKRLNGKLILIEGNHDERKSNFLLKIKIKDHSVLLIHNPEKIQEWKGWIIHGHHHNNHLEDFPLINYKNKTINVSVELTNYKPISLTEIIKLIEKPTIEDQVCQ